MSEAKRGCGYRKIGALYLVGSGSFVPCHRLPVKIPGISFFRGYKGINPKKLIGLCPDLYADKCPCDLGCPICNPPDQDIHGLMFVGESYYTPDSFMSEAVQMGISKRIPNIPDNLVLGKSIVYLAYKKMPFRVNNGTEYLPAIFTAFKPSGIETLVRQSDATEEKLQELKDKGITAVIISDNDTKHQ